MGRMDPQSLSSRETLDCEVAVVGGGPAGLLAALLSARAGARTTLVAPLPRSDPRTTALLHGSVAILREAGVWPALEAEAAPLRTLRIVDGGRRLLRAPEALFEASELGLPAFGWNVPNERLTAALSEAFDATAGARSVVEEARSSLPGADAVVIGVPDGGELRASLAIAADGRSSMLREAAGVGFRSRRTSQTALAFAVSHELDHEGVSTEIQSEEGPFTLVPMPGRRSSVVWAAAPGHAEELLALPSDALAEAATRKSRRLLGRMAVDGPVGSFPVAVGVAACFAARRTLLVGEAGHVLPPIGAQGLNLGFRDAACAAAVVSDALSAGRDLGGDATLRAYGRRRAADVWTRTAATGLLNLSLMTSFLPAHAARGLGLAAVSRVGPLRRFVMREGLAGGPAF